mgnify:CR=1 FL=1
MAKTFYVSDMHFFHKNAIEFDNRPWKTVEEMNEGLIKIWNERVSDEDTVYILGDISWSSNYDARCIYARLHGKKYWVTGNHDDKMYRNEELRRQFVEVYEGYHKAYELDGRCVILSHYPIFMYDGIRRKNVHLYGHVHTNEMDCRLIEKWKAEYEAELGMKIPMYNVGVMVPYMEWGPKTLNEIIEANGGF